MYLQDTADNMKYTPDVLLTVELTTVVEYLLREFNKIAETLNRPEAIAINYGKEYRNVASTTATTIDWREGQKQKVELNSSTTFTFVVPEGVCNLMFKLVYNGSYTPTFPSTVKWQGGTVPTWSAANGKTDVVAMYYDGTNFHATASLNSK